MWEGGDRIKWEHRVPGCFFSSIGFPPHLCVIESPIKTICGFSFDPIFFAALCLSNQSYQSSSILGVGTRALLSNVHSKKMWQYMNMEVCQKLYERWKQKWQVHK